MVGKKESFYFQINELNGGEERELFFQMNDLNRGKDRELFLFEKYRLN